VHKGYLLGSVYFLELNHLFIYHIYIYKYINIYISFYNHIYKPGIVRYNIKREFINAK
jgi:hypothetical protein